MLYNKLFFTKVFLKPTAERSISFPLKLLFFILLGQISPYQFAQAETAQDKTELTLWYRNFDSAPVDKILALALHKTEDLFGKAQITRSQHFEYHQAITLLKQSSGEIRVISAASSVENDRDFLVVRFPVLKGLLGNRICLIKKGDQSRFKDIQTIHDFHTSSLKVCQVESWPDTDILRRNGLPLLTSKTYNESFTNLYKENCDCFLRGAQEINKEHEDRKKALDIEQEILVKYSEPGFIYLNKADKNLATRIELGLLRALDDGSYQKLFDTLMKEKIASLNLGKRRVIHLVNPTPSQINKEVQDISKLWY